MTTIVVIIVVSTLSLLLMIVVSRIASKKNHIEKEEDENEDSENTEYIECPACRGIGGHYVNSNDDDDAEYEVCEECDGDGEIPDKRTREQKLNDWENEADQWIGCMNCHTHGFIYTENDQKVACPICDGYGVVKDTRTPEEKEAAKIAAEKKLLQIKLDRFIEDNERDFYGDQERKQYVKHLEARLERLNSELYSINNYIKDLKETTTKATEEAKQTLLKELHGISKDIWEIIILILILLFVQCSNNNKINDKINEVRDDISEIKQNIQ